MIDSEQILEQLGLKCEYSSGGHYTLYQLVSERYAIFPVKTSILGGEVASSQNIQRNADLLSMSSEDIYWEANFS